MDILLLGIYAFFVWLIFIKFKWLPWNITSQVIVVTIPIVALTIMILTLNVVAPSSAKLRVFKYTIPIVSQVSGRVLEVPVEEGNRPVHKGDVLFQHRPDAVPARCRESRSAACSGARRAARDRGVADGRNRQGRRIACRDRAGDGAHQRSGRQARPGEKARRAVPRARAIGRRHALRPRAGRGEPRRADRAARVRAQRAGAGAGRGRQQALASVGQVRQKLGTKVDGTYAQVAQIRAQLANAKWVLDQTTTTSPCECYVINLQLRPGAFVAALPLNPVMTLVEADGQRRRLLRPERAHQGRSRATRPSSRSRRIPDRSSRAPSIRSSGRSAQGQLPATGTIPMSTLANQPPGTLRRQVRHRRAGPGALPRRRRRRATPRSIRSTRSSCTSCAR